ncbi:uncharacterized protein MELLADRAFT_62036 [Melampsora larici-populina 98AG31]|uniref:Uncharacterized protein n=1 Tax=Melampsora larici-populina (strain 98AG31 / pathotype 3-4-7) TaxID=747676 RepID=F4RH04_MELLP|nr:uncharacterized protein MELLADRAFT_62036 [Melampsora larici-populina 98AG31]EGG08220.1 hypothetical protein MELLADRAFT_62036 [Melampsora larici-populina 98AG31]
MYHIAQLGPKIKSSQGNCFVVFNDEALRSFMKDATRRAHMLKRHVSETFEGDYQKGYPENNTNQKQHGSVWADWRKKTHEIRKTAENVQWKKLVDPQTNGHEPILLLNGDNENDTRVKSEESVSEFIHKWEIDFKNTIKFLKTAQSEKSGFPALSIKDFCRGIHTFLKQNYPTKISKYQVTLFSEFLHQDSKDRFYAEFWDDFKLLENKKLKNALMKKNSRVKKGKL